METEQYVLEGWRVFPPTVTIGACTFHVFIVITEIIHTFHSMNVLSLQATLARGR